MSGSPAHAVGLGKLMPLDVAVRRHVRPGDHIHTSFASGRPNAALRALACAFWDERPEFTISSTAVGGSQVGLFLVVRGLVRSLIAGFVGHQYPAPRPSRTVSRLCRLGELTLDEWSLLTFLERLRAGSRGQDWVVTSSLAEESLPAAQAQARRVKVDDSGSITLVPALTPDVAFVHGAVADEDGNTVLAFPYAEGALGAMAAGRGAIVTVERVVSRRELARYQGLPMIPSMFVSSVSEARYGAHPSGIYADSVDPQLSYADDYAFMHAMADALEGSDALAAEWTDRWILGGADPGDYAAELGDEHLEMLSSWWRTPTQEAPSISGDSDATPAERMIVAAASRLAEACASERPDFLFAGIGTSSLAAWLARQLDGAEGTVLLSELGFYDYTPHVGDPWLFSFASLASAAGLMDTETMLGAVVQGKGARGMAVLAAGQVDQFGQINTSWSDGRWLTGSGGANDVASSVRDITVLVPHDLRRLKERVEYPTSPGGNVRRIVTDLAILERRDEEFELTHLLQPLQRAEVSDLLAAVLELTPWALKVADDVMVVEAPSTEQLAALRRLDPNGFFTNSSTAVPAIVPDVIESRAS